MTACSRGVACGAGGHIRTGSTRSSPGLRLLAPHRSCVMAATAATAALKLESFIMPEGDGSAKVVLTMSFACDSYREADRMEARLRHMLTETSALIRYAAGRDAPEEVVWSVGGTASSSSSSSTHAPPTTTCGNHAPPPTTQGPQLPHHAMAAPVAPAAAPESPRCCTEYVSFIEDDEMMGMMGMTGMTGMTMMDMLEPIPATLLPDWL